MIGGKYKLRPKLWGFSARTSYHPKPAFTADSWVITYGFMGTKSTVEGGCAVGEQSFIGINSVVFDDRQVGQKCIVVACSAVKRDLPDFHVCKTKLESMQVKATFPGKCKDSR